MHIVKMENLVDKHPVNSIYKIFCKKTEVLNFDSFLSYVNIEIEHFHILAHIHTFSSDQLFETLSSLYKRTKIQTVTYALFQLAE